MKNIKFLILFFLFFFISALPCLSEDEDRQGADHLLDYTMGPGDLLHISVWKNPELTMVVTILPDGKISFPLIGDMIASGKTVPVFKKEFCAKIEQYVPDPELSVIVQQVNSLMVYVMGRVNRPGHLVLNANINVLQALAMSGGLNPFAKKNKILIFREVDGKIKTFKFMYKAVVQGENLEQNILLRRGDTIVVP